ncbi:ribonuclease H-like domain-containing protein [Mycena capillaripes]|nr:ribonuclease H-like domain-containing protein [Mycena capillaripes]
MREKGGSFYWDPIPIAAKMTEIPYNSLPNILSILINADNSLVQYNSPGGWIRAGKAPEFDATTHWVTVYTDGSAIYNETDNVKAGAGIYFGVDNPQNMAVRIPCILGPSNQVGEIIAIKEAVEAAPLDAPLRIFSDSKYAIDGLTKNLQRWQDEVFRTIENGDLVGLTVAKIRERKAPTEFIWVKGHSGVAGSEEADKLAGEGSRKADEDEINVEALTSLVLPGAKLKMMTQAKAYKIIRKLKMEKSSYRELLDKRATLVNMKIAKTAAARINGNTPPARKFWQSTRDKEIPRSIRFFLWMLLHEGYKIGHYWDNIPNLSVSVH